MLDGVVGRAMRRGRVRTLPSSIIASSAAPRFVPGAKETAEPGRARALLDADDGDRREIRPAAAVCGRWRRCGDGEVPPRRPGSRTDRDREPGRIDPGRCWYADEGRAYSSS